MSFDKAIEHGKEKRKQYRGAKRVDHTCRNHGSCSYCTSGRLHKYKRKEPVMEDNDIMDLDDKVKEKIDSMSYEELFTLWRFAPIGDPMFVGAAGDYFSERMRQTRPSIEEQINLSKRVGWEK